ncbi:MAG: hypothetical protein LBR06_09420 [Bacteroidales bacterium]|jgi:hypothetical protein|nr:hypothetical protein [Bacteroidales bacterium]
MKKFLLKITIFAIPLAVWFGITIAAYLLIDPFKVLYKYDNFYAGKYIGDLNRDYVSTENYIRHRDSANYNSFIFGSSRVYMGFKPSIWKKYLPENAQPYSFDAYSESVYGIWSKVKFLDKTDATISNALIVLCHGPAFRTEKNSTGYLFRKHPALSGENWLSFQYTVFQPFLHPKKAYSYIDLWLTGRYKNYMKFFIPPPSPLDIYDPVTNERFFNTQEKNIRENPDYINNPAVFYDRPDTEHVDEIRRIKRRHAEMLQEIRTILDKRHTDYRVIISPLYEQIRLNPDDLQLLHEIFGADKVTDFTGKNAFSDNKRNYYEPHHFRSQPVDSLLKTVYEK